MYGWQKVGAFWWVEELHNNGWVGLDGVVVPLPLSHLPSELLAALSVIQLRALEEWKLCGLV